MGDKSDQSIMDKSMRSVFGKYSILVELSLRNSASVKIDCLLFTAVGNIPYEATEEKLKDIFSEVGPVISLK